MGTGAGGELSSVDTEPRRSDRQRVRARLLSIVAMAVLCLLIPELPEVVAAPTLHAAAARQRTRVRKAGADRAHAARQAALRVVGRS
jgi:hypothetical protein